MRTDRKVWVPAILFILFSTAFGPSTFALTLEEVSNELVCQCGCGLVLENCNHSDCGVAIPMRETIKERIANGESKEQIISYFVGKYGEIVLAAPTKRGFNLTVWIMPFLGIIAGAGIVVWLIATWVRQGRETVSQPANPEGTGRTAENDEADEQIFKEELKDYE